MAERSIYCHGKLERGKEEDRRNTCKHELLGWQGGHCDWQVDFTHDTTWHLFCSGCGLNVLNDPPLGSLSQLKPESSTLTLERIAALIMARFGPMWELFVNERGSFEPFLKLYLDRWMHSYVSYGRLHNIVT